MKSNFLGVILGCIILLLGVYIIADAFSLILTRQDLIYSVTH